jgi:hypothetical protein
MRDAGVSPGLLGLRKRPIRSISTSHTSPGAIHSGGVRAKPTPAGVPQAMTSPGSSVVTWLRQETSDFAGDRGIHSDSAAGVLDGQ